MPWHLGQALLREKAGGSFTAGRCAAGDAQPHVCRAQAQPGLQIGKNLKYAEK